MLLLGLVFTISASVSAAAVDTYCGPPPYPEKIPALPSGPYNGKLDLSLLLFRHGDRTPTANRKCWNAPSPVEWDTCSLEQWDTPSVIPTLGGAAVNPVTTAPLPGETAAGGNCHVGQLTAKGARQAFNNGLRAGEYYRGLFQRSGISFHPSQIKGRSTDYHRTRQTGESFLRGFFASGMDGESSWVNPRLSWTDAECDNLAAAYKTCPGLYDYVTETYADPQWQKYTETVVTPLKAKIKAAAGISINVQDTFDCLESHKCQGKALPEGFTEELQAEIVKAATYEWDWVYHWNHTRSSQLVTGPLLVDLYSRLSALYLRETKLKNAKANIEYGSQAPYMRMYSGHDFGPMFNFIVAMSMYPQVNEWPGYQSLIQMDVYRLNNGDRVVGFNYNGRVLRFSWCNNAQYCPVSQVLDYMARLLPTPAQCPRMKTPAALAPTLKEMNERPQEMLTSMEKEFVQRAKALAPFVPENLEKHDLLYQSTLKPMSDVERLLLPN